MVMTKSKITIRTSLEQFLAELTVVAYGVVLTHGVKGPFIDLELDLWRNLREAVEKMPMEGTVG